MRKKKSTIDNEEETEYSTKAYSERIERVYRKRTSLHFTAERPFRATLAQRPRRRVG